MIFYDIETTGLNVLQDRIIEIYALKINGNERTEMHHFINPGIHIPQEASDIHGYTDDFVRDKPLLIDVIHEISNFFENESLCGYNIKKYDNLIMDVEFSRYDYDFNLDARKVIDVYELWAIMEPRSLAGALKRFCNEESNNLHGAMEDVVVTNRVYNRMLEYFSLGDKPIDEIAALSTTNGNLLCNGKLKVSDDMHLIFNFGKYFDMSIQEVDQFDHDYLRWMINESNVDGSVKYYIDRELKRLNNTNMG